MRSCISHCFTILLTSVKINRINESNIYSDQFSDCSDWKYSVTECSRLLLCITKKSVQNYIFLFKNIHPKEYEYYLILLAIVQHYAFFSHAVSPARRWPRTVLFGTELSRTGLISCANKANDDARVFSISFLTFYCLNYNIFQWFAVEFTSVYLSICSFKIESIIWLLNLRTDRRWKSSAFFIANSNTERSNRTIFRPEILDPSIFSPENLSWDTGFRLLLRFRMGIHSILRLFHEGLDRLTREVSKGTCPKKRYFYVGSSIIGNARMHPFHSAHMCQDTSFDIKVLRGEKLEGHIMIYYTSERLTQEW